mmetsp:Transcript_16557/g.28168  ORF Transcript_16557/g.28168 Transcript_16557/m.28168 type:complete len:120 (+) Transcript_16557:1049-1408(+)
MKGKTLDGEQREGERKLSNFKIDFSRVNVNPSSRGPEGGPGGQLGTLGIQSSGGRGYSSQVHGYQVEDVYCFCQNISYGDMVACDNPSCKYEWFHFPCVGITLRPEDSWYCFECQDKKK